MEGHKKINDIIINKPTDINSNHETGNIEPKDLFKGVDKKYNPTNHFEGHIAMNPRAMFNERIQPRINGPERNYNQITNPIRMTNNISNIILRRERILKFLHKDQFQITHPDLRPFIDERHAYECLIPYHIFSKPAYEDLLFLNTEGYEGLEEEILNLINKVDKELKGFDECQKIEQNIILNILGLREVKYIFDRLNEHLNNQEMPIEKQKKRKYIRKSEKGESSEMDIAEQAIVKLKLLRRSGEELINEEDGKIILKFNKQ